MILYCDPTTKNPCFLRMCENPLLTVCFIDEFADKGVEGEYYYLSR